MAIVNSNPIVNGLSGMLGKTLVFRTLRGKTIISSRPTPPKKQSEQQRTNRSKFKEASFWAKCVLRDPVKKEYYQKKARKLKLPNAYTAAIADYMRNPQVKEMDRRGDVITYHVIKKDFDVKKVEIKKTSVNGEIIETKPVTKDRIHAWSFTLSEEEIQWGVYVNITNESGQLTSMKMQAS